MLSIRPIGATPVEVNYYSNLGAKESHDYYSEDGVRPGVWWGTGAAALGLSGDVSPEEFKNILEQRSPDGNSRLVQERQGKIRNRAGFDLTFTVPKSWSVAWSQADEPTRAQFDERASRALARTVGVFQDLCGSTRRGKDGVIEENAKLVGAIFSHDTARGVPGEVPDANKHFHAVIANVVVREDGTTGALNAKPLFEKRMKMALGAMFRAELSKEMEEMGLRTIRPKRERTNELVSWFELEAVPEGLIKAMSKRRNEIEKWLRKRGVSGAKASEKAALLTREVKGRFTQQELDSAWQKLGQEHGFTARELTLAITPNDCQNVDLEKEKTEAAKRALKSLMNSQSRFSKTEFLEQVAIEAQTHRIGIKEIQEAVCDTLQNSKDIVRLKEVDGLRQFTTEEMLHVEARMLSAAERLNQTTVHAVSLQDVHAVIKNTPTLRVEQREAIRHICSGSDVACVNGIAGSGKTFMLSVAREAWERAGYEVVGTTLAAKAARGLEEGSGIKSLHIHKLVQAVQNKELSIGSNNILVVDESGMVGTRMMEKLTQMVEQKGAKLVLVGDHRQLQAISAGAAFRVIGERVGNVELEEIVRQKESCARRVVRDVRDGRAENALHELSKRGQLFIGANHDSAISQLVNDWTKTAIDLGELKGSMVFAGTNVDVRELNARCQEKRMEAGHLGQEFVEIDGLTVHVGDRVMVTRNDKLLNLSNGSTGEVTAISGSFLRVRIDGQFQVEINTERFSSLTLGYAMSTHKGQGVTCKNAYILSGDMMTDREMSYVQVSRARVFTKIYSDVVTGGADIEELAARMSRSRPKDLAHEHLPEVA